MRDALEQGRRKETPVAMNAQNLIGRKVCFTNPLGLKRYGRIVAVSKNGELVEVAWEEWPGYLASLPRVTKADREYAAAGTQWNHLPGVDSIVVPGREQPLKIAPIMLVEE